VLALAAHEHLATAKSGRHQVVARSESRIIRPRGLFGS